jgi:serralysin
MLMFATSPDFEAPADADTDNIYQVTVHGNAGGEMGEVAVTVTVTNVDELGMISGDATPSYAENEMGSVATYTASGPDKALAIWSPTGVDAGAFTITGGVLAFGSAPDYENPADADEDNVYEVTITANHGPDTATRDVAVAVTNVDELGG